MNNGSVFVLFILLIAFLSALLYMGVSRKIKKRNLDVIKMTCFFFAGFAFLVSAVKWYTGNREDTLSESLWDSSSATYIHYGFPLIAAGIIVMVICMTLLKKQAESIIKAFVAYFFLGILLSFFLGGRVSNTVFCVVFLASVVFSLITIVLYRKEWDYIEKKDYLKTFVSTLPFVGAVFFTNGIFLPNELYLSNIDEFLCPYTDFFIVLLVGDFLFVILFIVLSMFILPKFLYKGLKLIIAAMSIMGYIQNMFLNGKLQSMDGGGQIWSLPQSLVNIVIWLVVVGLLGVGGYYKVEVEKLIKIACIYIVLIQTLTLGYLIITMEQSNADRAALTTHGSLELGTGNNVIVFVLDRFDSIWMETLLEEDSQFCEPLADFIYYSNATSQFAHTGTALPYMLTGVKWQEDNMGENSYSEYAYENGDFLKILEQNDYDKGIYTGLGYLSEATYGMADNYRETVDVSCDMFKTLELMWKSSMYKTTPFILKSAYEYYSGDMVQMARTEEIWNIDNDIPFYNSLMDKGLSVTDEYQNTFRFYHMRGAHYPYYLSEDMQYNKSGRDVSVYSQIRGCLNIVYKYMEQMKALGVYNDATIIITADHGKQIEFIEEQNRPNDVSMPILLVKEANQKKEQIQVSSAPVSQEELIPTILKVVGEDWTCYGMTLDEVKEDTREREYLDIYNDYFIKYTITGDAKELDNWSGIAIK